MVAATFIGLYIGIYLDKWLETAPWMTMILLGIGIAAGFRNIFILTRRGMRELEPNGEKDQEDNGSD